MKYYRFWARGRGTIEVEGKPEDVSSLGGSNESLADAERQAQRQIELIGRKIKGEPGVFSEYHVPIKEELIREISPKAIITRNHYGSLILNAANMMIMDIDQAPSQPLSFLGFFGLGKKNTKSPKERIIEMIEKHVASGKYGDLSARVYETVKGIRCIISNAAYDPCDAQTIHMLRAFNNDPLYSFLCRKQQCFRARLTPKPHRCKFHRPPTKFPRFEPKEIAEFEEWRAKYDDLSKDYASCRFVTEFGSGRLFRDVIDVHDEICGARSSRKLA